MGVDWTEGRGEVGDCAKRSVHTSHYLEKQKGGKVEKVERDKKKAHQCAVTGFKGEIFSLRRPNRVAGRV